MTIQKAAVLGAGSMGAGIAALLASAGIDVLLFDITREGAQKGIDIQIKRKGFYHPSHVEKIRPAVTGEDLQLLEDRDWVIEAIFEDLDAKHDLYAQVEPHLKDGALLTSNTSTLPLARLLEGITRPETFAITHFFNPPKIMRLVELVANNDDTAATLRLAIEQQLGKIALDCCDTPGFIANRVGCYWLAAGRFTAREHGVSYELADAAFGRAFGIPRTGVFGLLDYIGLQLVAPIWGSLEAALPQGDRIFDVPLGRDEFIAGLVERGLTGRTGEGGFYRGRDESVREDYSYGPRLQPDDPVVGLKDPREVMDTDSPGGRFARDLFLATLRYCCEVAPDIADHVGLIDDGLKLGFGWKKGIFELADAVGHEWLVAALAASEGGVPALVEAASEGFYPAAGQVLSSTGNPVELPERPGVVTLAGLRAAGATAVLEHEAGTLHHVDAEGRGIGIIDLHTPLNSLPTAGLAFLRACVEHAAEAEDIDALVIGNDEARAFSAGADLPTIAEAAASGDAERVRGLIRDGSETMRALRFAPVPIVGAVRGVALGGGCELALACDRLVIHADTKVGFPERNVGLYPGWGGSIAMLEHNLEAGHADAHQRAFDFIASATPAPNAYFARDVDAVRESDVILMSPDHVLARAIEEAAALAEGYTPRTDVSLPLYSGQPPLDAAWPLEDTTDNDHAIVAQLAKVYTAGSLDEQEAAGDANGAAALSYSEFSDREVELDVPVLLWPANVERSAHMARTRTPLRN